jgi:alpha-ketoglutarate-dependent taurine dioxygenase
MKKLGLKKGQRRTVSASSEALVREEALFPDRPQQTLPTVFRPTVDGIDLVAWAKQHRQQLEERLWQTGGLLFRGFAIDDPKQLSSVVAALSDRWAEYREPATPRSQVEGNIFTSTDYPAHETIYLHNENSHCESWPMKIFFLSLVAAEEGGETPIADCRRVYLALEEHIKERFLEKRILYVRNLGPGMGIPWQKVFNTEDRDEVARYCRDVGMELEWKDEDHLRIRYVRDAVVRHPWSGEELWFNHGTFFNIGTLSPALRESLLAQMPMEDLPYNTYYGDGSPIEEEVLARLHEVYAQETVAFPWKPGDLLMLDNMRVAHGRRPFRGERRVVVGMAEPVSMHDVRLESAVAG